MGIRLNGTGKEHDLAFDLGMNNGRETGEIALSNVSPELAMQVMYTGTNTIDIVELGIRASVLISFISANHIPRLGKRPIIGSYDLTFTMYGYKFLEKEELAQSQEEPDNLK